MNQAFRRDADGLQIRGWRFDSARCLHLPPLMVGVCATVVLPLYDSWCALGDSTGVLVKKKLLLSALSATLILTPWTALFAVLVHRYGWGEVLRGLGALAMFSGVVGLTAFGLALYGNRRSR